MELTEDTVNREELSGFFVIFAVQLYHKEHEGRKLKMVACTRPPDECVGNNRQEKSVRQAAGNPSARGCADNSPSSEECRAAAGWSMQRVGENRRKILCPCGKISTINLPALLHHLFISQTSQHAENFGARWKCSTADPFEFG